MPELPIPKPAVKGLLFVLFLAIIYHFINHPEFTPVWVVIVSLPIGVFSYRRIMRDLPLPSKTIRIVFTLGAVAAVALTQRPIMGRDPGIIALILLSCMKLMELRTRRDFMFTVFMCYFLLFGNFLYDQSLQDLAFTLAAFILVTAVLLRLNYPENEKSRFSTFLKSSFKYFIYGLPFTVVLFLLFPRTYGPFWNLPQDKRVAMAGFNSFIRPGQIAELAQADFPAFQVEFPGNNMPAAQDLYFRGFVLWYNNGDGWHHGNVPRRYRGDRRLPRGGIEQLITLAPHNQRWLFGLDWPIHTPRWSYILPGSIFQTRWEVKNPFRYRVISRMEPPSFRRLPKVHRKWALQMPRVPSRPIVELANQWRREAKSDEDIVRKAETYYKENSFIYSISPGLMDIEDPFADFLFEKRRGFCEHFAGSFAYLMRAAGVPSRVVLGYQGGEYNDVGDYLKVKQRDAHAWAEVWIEGKGWQRVDPTSWVSPERLEYGLEMSQRLGNMQGMDEANRSQAIQRALEKGFLERAWDFIKKHWDNIKYKWDTWIISYDIFRQRNFFSSLGLGRLSRSTLFLALLVIIPLMLFILAYFLKRQTPPADPLLRVYFHFCNKLKKAGLQRFKWEGPRDYEKRALEKFPRDARIISYFTDLFIALRYGNQPTTKQHLKQLKKSIRKLK